MAFEIRVLDHGYVKLLDVMGDVWEPVRAARVSYNDSLKGVEADRKLLKYLLVNRHTTPFEMVELKWEVKLPIFVARQWVRHRTANINEMSLRYTEPVWDFYVPEHYSLQDDKNKQGSTGHIDERTNKELQEFERGEQLQAKAWYEYKIKQGVSREQARIGLPVSLYTKWIWKNDLHNTLHFLNLRNDPHAQWEMQQYAQAMQELMAVALPELMEVWEEVRG